MKQTTCWPAWAIGGLGTAYFLGYVVLAGLRLVQPFSLINLLLSAGVLTVGAYALLRRRGWYFAGGVMVLIAGHVFLGQRFAPDHLTSGAIVLTGILVLYVGLKIHEHLSRTHLLAFVAGYGVLFWIFVLQLQNAEPLFILYLLGLAAAARSLRLTAYFWAVVVSFTFCQPYAWESLAALAFLLTALFGARGPARSPTTLLFLGVGLLVVLSLLFPVMTILLGQDLHSMKTLLRDVRIRQALLLTFASAAVSTVLLLLTMTPLAYALSRLRFPGRDLLLSLIDLPIVIPQSAAGIALLLLLGRKQFFGGALADYFGMYFDGTVLGICAAQIFVAMPFMAKSALAAFDAVDQELEGVAGTLGAPAISVFGRIALPLAARGVALGAVLAFARAAGEFGALLFLAPTPETAPIAVFNRFSSMGMTEVAPLVGLLLLLSLGTFFLLQLGTRLLPSARQAGPEAIVVEPADDGRKTVPGRGEKADRNPSLPQDKSESLFRTEEPSSDQPVLQVRDLHLAVGSFRLGPIAMELYGGDYVVLMGPSGCGKTTLLKTLAGMLPRADGEIWINGQRVDARPAAQRRVGYVPQHSLLFPHLTVADNVRFALRYQRLTPDQRKLRFEEAVVLAGIRNLLARFPVTLSGGEARRAALARALATGPAVLLLDEPLSMLDPEGRRELLQVLKSLRQNRNVAALHVTHQEEEAQAIAGPRGMFGEGRIVMRRSSCEPQSADRGQSRNTNG